MKKVLALTGMLLIGAVAGPVQAQVDAEAAQALAKKNDCFKCHAIDKTKKAPAYKRVAARLKTKPDGVETIVEHITSGHMVQLEDGSEEKHKIVDTQDPKSAQKSCPVDTFVVGAKRSPHPCFAWVILAFMDQSDKCAR